MTSTSNSATRRALIVRGGWDGHQPVEATELFIPFLEANGFTVRVEESPAVYADAAALAETDLIVQATTMSTIESEQSAGTARRGRGRHRDSQAGTAGSRTRSATTRTICSSSARSSPRIPASIPMSASVSSPTTTFRTASR